MVLQIEERPALTIKDLKGHTDPDWCPGCGDFGVLSAIYRAALIMDLDLKNTVIVSGIARAEPSNAKRRVAAGCLAGLRNHRLGRMKERHRRVSEQD